MPDPVDLYIGTRVKLRRTLIGLSQQALGDALGITFQQIQKYERGANRIGAGRLRLIAGALDVPLTYFFDGYNDLPPPARGALSEPPDVPFEHEQQLSQKESIDLLKAYYEIRDPKLRRRVIDLIRALAETARSAGA